MKRRLGVFVPRGNLLVEHKYANCYITFCCKVSVAVLSLKICVHAFALCVHVYAVITIVNDHV